MMRAITSLVVFLALAASSAVGQSSPVLYSTDFTTLDGWTPSGSSGAAWAADATPAAGNTFYHQSGYSPYLSPPASLNFNDGFWIGGPGSYDLPYGYRTFGTVTSPPVDLSASPRVPVLQFMAGSWGEGFPGFDVTSLLVRPAGGGPIWLDEPTLPVRNEWLYFEYELDASWGTVEIEFSFDTIDDMYNDGPGAFIDDLAIIDRCSIDPSSPCDDFLSFCFGDGSGTPCPCNNNTFPATRRGCRNSSGQGARLIPSGVPDMANDSLRFELDGAPPQTFAFLVSGDQALPASAPGDGEANYDGLRCVGGNFVRYGARATDLAGRVGFGTPGWGPPDAPTPGFVSAYGYVAGQSRYFQVCVRDDLTANCGSGGNRSNGVKVTFR